MRLILDTQSLIGLSTVTLAKSHRRIADEVANGGHDLCASVASLWEIAIKTRLGKLAPGLPVTQLAAFFEAGGISILAVTGDHVVADIHSEPSTRDPFDRLLLAQCKVERRQLMTVDQVLVGHPLSAGRF